LLSLRLLAEHLLRSGQHASGAALAAAAGVGELVDAELHGANAAVAAALRGGDSQQALAWCELHRAKLKKLRSTLEFRLRLQQFVELVRSGRQRDAVAHARLHVAPLAAGSNLRELQRAMALLVLKPQAPPRCSRHAALLSPAAWEALAEEFSADSARVHGLTRVPGVELRLQAGLCALNTPHAQRGERGGASARNDPLASALFARLAAGLPHTKHVHSRLVCPITQLVMNEDNPPAALPNGYVYSRAALEALAAASGGRLFCPRTGAGPFDVALLQKVFLA
jgi:macrophage erythroblast attacher